jgi:hypothetical protein
MKPLHPPVNFRGLFRVWIITTCAWAAYWIWYFVHCYALPEIGWGVYGPICPTTADFARPGLYLVILALVVPTIIAFSFLYDVILFGIIVVRIVFMIETWVVSGFREHKAKRVEDPPTICITKIINMDIF